MADTHIVFEHHNEDSLAGYDSNHRTPEPKEVFSGSEGECEAYRTRVYAECDLNDPGPYSRRPRLEIRAKRSRYSETDPA